MKINTIFLFLLFFSSYTFSQGWIKKDVGTQSHLYSVYFVDADTGYTVGQYGVIFKTTDSGETWSEQTSGVSTDLKSVFFTDDQTGYAVGNEGVILKTANGGLTWSLQTSGTAKDIRQVFFVDGTGYVAKNVSASDSSAILKTIDGGATWERTPTGGIYTGFYSIYFTSPTVGYGGGDPSSANGFYTYLLKTTNGGTDWISQDSHAYSRFIFSIFFIGNDTGYACGADSLILKTTDGGTNWKTVSPPVSGRFYSIVFTSEETGYIAGEREQGNLPLILKTTDYGENWVEQPQTEVQILNSIYFVNSGTGFACGDVGLMLKTTTGGATGVDRDGNFVPSEFSLDQNYPNPFNSTTKIRYSIPNVGASLMKPVLLKVYNALGEEVATLVNEQKPAGYYEVEFDASNLASGIYIYQMRTNNLTSSKKMLLLK